MLINAQPKNCQKFQKMTHKALNKVFSCRTGVKEWRHNNTQLVNLHNSYSTSQKSLVLNPYSVIFKMTTSSWEDILQRVSLSSLWLITGGATPWGLLWRGLARMSFRTASLFCWIAEEQSRTNSRYFSSRFSNSSHFSRLSLVSSNSFES